MAGGARKEATAGRKAAAAADAAAEPLISVRGRSRGGEKVLYASSGARCFGSEMVRLSGLKAARLGWVSTGMGGGTGEGVGVGIGVVVELDASWLLEGGSMASSCYLSIIARQISVCARS